MSDTLWAVVTGGGLAIFGGFLERWYDARRAKKAIANAIVAQIAFAKEKVERYKSGNITHSELGSGKPLFKAFAENVGNLSPEQAIQSTKALLMYFEVVESGKIERADEVIAACTEALKSFGIKR